MSSTGTESFTIGMHQVQPQKSPVQTQPSISSMRLAYAPDGTAIYKPVTSSAPPVSPFHPPEVPEQSPAFNANTSESMKKKRGRPRKYGPDGTMSLALVPAGGGASAGGAVPPGFQTSPGGTAGSGDAVRKSKGGRPLGSLNKKKQMAALGSQGIGFTPHVITVKAGEDVSAKIMAFSQNGPRAICILSANGAISNVTLRQAATSGGTVTYEGRFEILSLSGSFLVSELSGGQRSRTGGLSVSLAGPDGRVLGGGVAGLLTAASPIQVVVGSFIAEGGKKEKKEKKQVIYPDPLLAPRPVMAPTTGGSSSPSRGTMSESSGGPASPPNQSAGPFSSNNNNNNNPQSFANFPWK